MNEDNVLKLADIMGSVASYMNPIDGCGFESMIIAASIQQTNPPCLILTFVNGGQMKVPFSVDDHIEGF